ncbi:MAG TPA: endonuclease VIII [Bacillota bacterium]|nr:endonuclease VIII [Bacillota bacterium]
MLELPEAVVMAEQISKVLQGKRIVNVVANHSPQKLAWFYGDPEHYCDLLKEKIIDKATSYGGFVHIQAGEMCIIFNDGVGLRYFNSGEKLPVKHQLHLEFADGSSLVGSVQMYGGLGVFSDGQLDNPYYVGAKQKPSPLTAAFDYHYFESLLTSEKKTLSVKAFLATEQRVPGLGNGVLQDILWKARLHPRRKMASLSDLEFQKLFDAVKSTLDEMTTQGGRDTERDLYGCQGGYQTILSRNTVGKPCPVCGTLIKKESYLGGRIYYCESCQRL